MKEEERLLLKTSIERKLKRLTREAEELKEMSKPVAPENAIGRLSRMEHINAKSVAEASLRNCEKKIKGLRNALNNIADEDFGKCSKCGKEIALGRLKLMPESSRCVSCAN